MTSPILFVFTNNAQTTLAAPITNSATVVNLATGTGSLFPSPGAGQQFTLTLNDAATGLIYEICYCTGRSGDTCTVVRGQEGTTPVAWLAGDSAYNLYTAGTASSFAQPIQLQAQAGNYAADTGTANTYVVALNPVVSAYTNGLSFAVLFLNPNTGASTLNAGGGVVPLRRNDGTPLKSGDIIGGTLYRVTYVSALSQFLLNSPTGGEAFFQYLNANAAVSEGNYLLDTSTGGFTVTLPTSPVTPTAFTFADAKATWGVSSPIFNPGSNTIENTPGTFTCAQNGVQFSLYWDSTGTPTWRLV